MIQMRDTGILESLTRGDTIRAKLSRQKYMNIADIFQGEKHIC